MRKQVRQLEDDCKPFMLNYFRRKAPEEIGQRVGSLGWRSRRDKGSVTRYDDIYCEQCNMGLISKRT